MNITKVTTERILPGTHGLVAAANIEGEGLAPRALPLVIKFGNVEANGGAPLLYTEGVRAVFRQMPVVGSRLFIGYVDEPLGETAFVWIDPSVEPVPPVPPIPPPLIAHPMLRRGARGEAVREAQTKLNIVHSRNISMSLPRLQGAPLVVDGIFGQQTYSAVVSFQRQALPTDPREWDGIIGPKTWAKLDAASGNAPAIGLV